MCKAGDGTLPRARLQPAAEEKEETRCLTDHERDAVGTVVLEYPLYASFNCALRHASSLDTLLRHCECIFPDDFVYRNSGNKDDCSVQG